MQFNAVIKQFSTVTHKLRGIISNRYVLLELRWEPIDHVDRSLMSSTPMWGQLYLLLLAGCINPAQTPRDVYTRAKSLYTPCSLPIFKLSILLLLDVMSY